MKSIRWLRASLVVCAAWSLLVPPRLLAADQRLSESPDVQLTGDRQLVGQYVDTNGQPLAEQKLVLLRNMRSIGEATTDAEGRFVFSNLNGGVYQVVSPDQAMACRCWAPHTAPPNSSRELLLVARDDVKRGQRPIGEIFSNPLVIGALIAAAIAIPIAIHNSGDDESGS